MAQAATATLDTFPKLLRRNAAVRGGGTAFRHKDLGIWQSWTWAEVYETVRAYAVGLQTLGLKRGDKIAIVGANRPRLYWSMMAAQMIGAVPVPVVTTTTTTTTTTLPPPTFPTSTVPGGLVPGG